MSESTNYTSKFRLPDSIYKRDLELEKQYGITDIRLYGYVNGDISLYIVAEIFAHEPLAKDFCIICTLYDDDDDIIETTKCIVYGSGVVTSIISPASFFNGFPCVYSIFGVSLNEIKEIQIIPASSY